MSNPMEDVQFVERSMKGFKDYQTFRSYFDKFGVYSWKFYSSLVEFIVSAVAPNEEIAKTVISEQLQKLNNSELSNIQIGNNIFRSYIDLTGNKIKGNHGESIDEILSNLPQKTDTKIAWIGTKGCEQLPSKKNSSPENRIEMHDVQMQDVQMQEYRDFEAVSRKMKIYTWTICNRDRREGDVSVIAPNIDTARNTILQGIEKMKMFGSDRFMLCYERGTVPGKKIPYHKKIDDIQQKIDDINALQKKIDDDSQFIAEQEKLYGEMKELFERFYVAYDKPENEQSEYDKELCEDVIKNYLHDSNPQKILTGIKKRIEIIDKYEYRISVIGSKKKFEEMISAEQKHIDKYNDQLRNIDDKIAEIDCQIEIENRFSEHHNTFMNFGDCEKNRDILKKEPKVNEVYNSWVCSGLLKK